MEQYILVSIPNRITLIDALGSGVLITIAFISLLIATISLLLRAKKIKHTAKGLICEFLLYFLGPALSASVAGFQGKVYFGHFVFWIAGGLIFGFILAVISVAVLSKELNG